MIRSIRDVALLFGVAAIVSRLGHASGVAYFIAGLVASALIAARIFAALKLRRR